MCVDATNAKFSIFLTNQMLIDVLLNVFLAIAVENISLDDAEETMISEEEAAREEHMKEVKQIYAPNGSKNDTVPTEVNNLLLFSL